MHGCCVNWCYASPGLSVVRGAWSVRCVGWADWVDCRCFLSFVFLGDARRLELSPCNILQVWHNANGATNFGFTLTGEV